LVVELPTIDLGKAVPRANEQTSPEVFGPPIPSGQFGVRFTAHRESDKGLLPLVGVMFIVHQRGPSGSLVRGATGLVKRTSKAKTGIGTYEGVCPAPMRNGDAIIEVTYRDKSYFVRSARVQ